VAEIRILGLGDEDPLIDAVLLTDEDCPSAAASARRPTTW
jgi:hypothetical protein